MSWTSSERLMYVQFTSYAQRVISMERAAKLFSEILWIEFMFMFFKNLCKFQKRLSQVFFKKGVF